MVVRSSVVVLVVMIVRSSIVNRRAGGDGISITTHYHCLFADGSVAAMARVDVVVVVAVIVVVHWLWFKFMPRWMVVLPQC